jgi:YrhK-like protein
VTGTRAPAAPAHGYVELPEGWERVSAGGPGPFVTNEVLLRPDGTLVHWRSRAHRKAASHATRWMAALFAVGSICFLVASVAAQWASSPRPAIGVTFFAGSLLFTAASYLGFSEAVNVPREHLRARRLRLRPASWEPRRIDWLAAATQLTGALLFNVSTFVAMQHGLDARQTNLRVWAPDAAGSVCFLVASALAYAEVCHRWWCTRRRSLSWWIVALNLVGSVAFGIAAIASLIDPSTEALVNARIANAGTSLGAACSLAGALLLPREAAAERRSRESSDSERHPPSRGPER